MWITIVFLLKIFFITISNERKLFKHGWIDLNSFSKLAVAVATAGWLGIDYAQPDSLKECIEVD